MNSRLLEIINRPEIFVNILNIYVFVIVGAGANGLLNENLKENDKNRM